MSRMMQKADFEQIVMMPDEQKLFKRIKRHPGIKLDEETVQRLRDWHLVEQEYIGQDKTGIARYTDNWSVSEEGKRYIIYLRKQRLYLWTKKRLDSHHYLDSNKYIATLVRIVVTNDNRMGNPKSKMKSTTSNHASSIHSLTRFQRPISFHLLHNIVFYDIEINDIIS